MMSSRTLQRSMPEERNIRDTINHDVKLVTHIAQGDFRVTNHPGEIITSILGSCVAVCIHDPITGMGGMNHFLLARPEGDISNLGDRAIRYGSFLIERMVNAAIAMGAFRSSLQAKVFGGANMFGGESEIGSKNADFVEYYLRMEGLEIIASDLRGVQARKLRFRPKTGEVWLKRLNQPDRSLFKREQSINLEKMVSENAGKVEIFDSK